MTPAPTPPSGTTVLTEPYAAAIADRLHADDTWLYERALTPVDAVLRLWPGWVLAIPAAAAQPYRTMEFACYPLTRTDETGQTYWAAAAVLALDWFSDPHADRRRAMDRMAESVGVCADLTTLSVEQVAAMRQAPNAARSVQWWRDLWIAEHPDQAADEFDLLVGLQ